MILKIQGFDLEIKLKKGKPSILIIEDNLLFSNIISKINYYTNNNIEELEIILIDEDSKLLTCNKYIHMYIDIFNVDINSKRTLTKIYKQILNELHINIERSTYIQQKCNEINALLLSTILDIDIDLVYDEEVMLETYFKAINLRIDVENEILDVYERICFIIDIEAQLGLYAGLIFVNIFSYLDQKQILSLLNYIHHKNIGILFIEKNCYERINCNMYRIDKDYVEYHYPI